MTSSPCVHPERLPRIRPHGLPFLKTLSNASRVVVAMKPSSTALLRRLITASSGLQSFGQTILHVEQVVQEYDPRELASIALSPRSLGSYVRLANCSITSGPAKLSETTGHSDKHE